MFFMQFVVVYYPTWSIYSETFSLKNLEINSISHLTVAFAIPQKDGNINCEEIEKLNLFELRESFKSKLGISTGGWGTCEDFVFVMESEEKRRIFVNCCLGMVEKYNLDYLEIDWEYPKDENEMKNLICVIHELRELLPKTKQISLCVPCFKSELDVSKLEKIVDFFILMGFDLFGNWSNVSGHHAAIYPTISNYVDYLTKFEGIDSKKIVLACPLYGRVFKSCKGIDNAFDACEADTTICYNEIITRCQNIMYDPDCVGQSAILNDDLVSFDGPLSVEAKCNWIKQNQLGGIAFWNAIGDGKNNEVSLIQFASNLLK